jgi:histone-lysine N-methyltransferase SETMAR
MLSKKVLLHHNNARPHTAAAKVETELQLGFEILQHPPDSPDLAPSDYHIFGPLKKALRGRGFASDEELKRAAENYFSAGIQALVERYNKCIVLQDDYVEK